MPAPVGQDIEFFGGEGTVPTVGIARSHPRSVIAMAAMVSWNRSIVVSFVRPASGAGSIDPLGPHGRRPRRLVWRVSTRQAAGPSLPLTGVVASGSLPDGGP